MGQNDKRNEMTKGMHSRHLHRKSNLFLLSFRPQEKSLVRQRGRFLAPLEMTKKELGPNDKERRGHDLPSRPKSVEQCLKKLID